MFSNEQVFNRSYRSVFQRPNNPALPVKALTAGFFLLLVFF